MLAADHPNRNARNQSMTATNTGHDNTLLQNNVSDSSDLNIEVRVSGWLVVIIRLLLSKQ